jgi:uncharacterized RmlC-like cupin family protein
MGEEPPQQGLELAVAIGRVEEGIKNLGSTLTTMAGDQKTHGDTLTRHEVAIRVLESRQQPRVHWLTILVGVVAVAGFTLALLDRIFTTTP